MELELSPDEVSKLISLLPAELRGPQAGFLYVDGSFIVPDEHIDAVEAVTEDDDWLDADPAPVVPTSASKLGLIRAFKELGSWADVKAAIAADDDVQEEWEAAQEIRRTDPIVQGMIEALNLSNAQVDALLIRANELVA